MAMSASLNWIAWNSEMELPNCSPFLRPCQRLVEAGLREPHREGGDRDPPPVERREELPETFSSLAEQVLLGYAAVLEVEWVLVGGAPAKLLVAGPRV